MTATMQMGYDFQDGSQGVVPQARTGAFAATWLAHGGLPDQGLAPARPEWAGLKARFMALHALRRTIDSAVPAAFPAGSFIESAEAMLASARGQGAAVNLIRSGNGKAAGGKVGSLSPTVPREATEDHHD